MAKFTALDATEVVLGRGIAAREARQVVILLRFGAVVVEELPGAERIWHGDCR